MRVVESKVGVSGECLVNFQPVGRRVEVVAGTTLMEAARSAGVELVSICGGAGICGECKVRLAEGCLSAPTLEEEAEFSDEQLESGLRLACQARVLGPVRVDIPPESLASPQRLQVEGQMAGVPLDPLVMPVDVQIVPPDLYDLRSDLTRLRAALIDSGYEIAGELGASLSVLSGLSGTLRGHHWRVRLAIRGSELVAVLPYPPSELGEGEGVAPHDLLGLAVDLGTTKLAAYLVHLGTGETLAKAGAMNPQIAYGEDVISRIAYTETHPAGNRVLQRRLVDTLNGLVGELCAGAGAHRAQVLEAVIVGNTAMHHLFAGLPVAQLGQAPYVPAVGQAMEFRAAEIGLELAAGAHVYLPPNIAGYVGADHVSMLLATEAGQAGRTAVALDIGTNTEISLFHAGRVLTCSCASGPAFEGAHIHDGMRAAPGAVERVRIDGDEVQVYTIDGQPAVGVCGSGILDAVAQMLGAGVIDARGVLLAGHPRVSTEQGKRVFVLVPDRQSGTGRDVLVTRGDVNEIQLAKGAIRAGVEILLREAGIHDEDIDLFVVAGAFGTYLDLESAIRTGMFPDLPRERFRQVGNAAGAGARAMLVSARHRRMACDMVSGIEYVELTTHPDFSEEYVRALGFHRELARG